MTYRSPTQLILVTGLPGAGKTTFAHALADKAGARHFNTDIIRAALGLRGQYDEASKKKVYREMEAQTRNALRSGASVVVDGTFYRESLREPYRQLGEEAGAQVSWLVIEAPEAVIRQRVSRQRAYSEADFEVYLKVRDAWEPLLLPHLTLRSEELPTMLDEALDYLRYQNSPS